MPTGPLYQLADMIALEPAFTQKAEDFDFYDARPAAVNADRAPAGRPFVAHRPAPAMRPEVVH